MITINGDICYRSHTSQCQKCDFYIKNINDPYKCWQYDYIPYRAWENTIGYECKYFNSILKHQCNSHYVHQDYEDRDRFPEKKFGGKYRFNSKGERI